MSASLARAALRARFPAAPRAISAALAPQTASGVGVAPVRGQNTQSVSSPAPGAPPMPGTAGVVVSRGVDRAAAMRGDGPAFHTPTFWSGTPAIDPDLFTIDCAGIDMTDMDGPAQKDIAARARALYARYGVVLLTGTGLGDNLAHMRDWGLVPMDSAHKYEGGANYRGELVENVYDTGAPATAHLHYHHEMAYLGVSTTALAFCCQHSAGPRGDSYLSDNIAATDAVMATEVGRKLKERGVTYIRCMTDEEDGYAGSWEEDTASGVYNHWQRSMLTRDPAEAEATARRKGLEVEWGPGRYMRTKFTISAFEYEPVSGRNVLYSSVADDNMWFDTWTGVAELPLLETFAGATPAQRPLRMTYGDGTEFTDEELRDYSDAYDAGGIRVRWRQGDVLTFCNKRFAHGRPAYTLLPGERREIGVVLGPMYERLGELPEGW